MVLYAVDQSRGHGTISFLEGDQPLECTCVRGHLTSFRLDELRRFRWRPRYAS
jgi:hypothetical protein